MTSADTRIKEHLGALVIQVHALQADNEALQEQLARATEQCSALTAENALLKRDWPADATLS